MSRSRRVSDIVALGAAVLGMAYGAYLVVIGPSSPYLTPGGVAGTIQSPTLAGLIPLGIGLLAIWAVVSRRTGGLWAAGVLALVSSLVFLFSFSLQFAALAAPLFLAAFLRTAATGDIARR